MGPPVGALASPGSMRMEMAMSGAENAGFEAPVSVEGPAAISQPNTGLGQNQRRASSTSAAVIAAAASHNHHGCADCVGGGAVGTSGATSATGADSSGAGPVATAIAVGAGSLAAGVVG